VVSFSGGARHSAAVTKEGLIFTWGDAEGGLLGHGDNPGVGISSLPVLVEHLKRVQVREVTCGNEATLCIMGSPKSLPEIARGLESGREEFAGTPVIRIEGDIGNTQGGANANTYNHHGAISNTYDTAGFGSLEGQSVGGALGSSGEGPVTMREISTQYEHQEEGAPRYEPQEEGAPRYAEVSVGDGTSLEEGKANDEVGQRGQRSQQDRRSERSEDFGSLVSTLDASSPWLEAGTEQGLGPIREGLELTLAMGKLVNILGEEVTLTLTLSQALTLTLTLFFKYFERGDQREKMLHP